MSKEDKNEILEYWKTKIKKENPHTWNQSTSSRNSCINLYITSVEKSEYTEESNDFVQKSLLALKELKKETPNEAGF